MLTDGDFRAFQQLVQREAGIHLSEQKRALLIGRLSPRLRALDLPSFAAYLERAQSDRDELVHMIDCLCTHETAFFREPRQFHFLTETLLPEWRRQAAAGDRRRSLRVWSAACSSGEEPFSIAMTLLAELPDWRHEVLASDLSTRVLERARAATWPIARAAEIPRPYLESFMLRGTRSAEGRMAARPEVAELVRFLRLNLCHEPWPLSGRFDLVFCRNVLIYFDAPTRRRIVDRLLDRLEPGGLLLLGHAESLHSCDHVRAVGPTIYALR